MFRLGVMCAITLAGMLGATELRAQTYRLPLGDGSHSCGGGSCVLTAYRDHGGGSDWNCGSQTYAGHTGTDIAPIHSFGDCVQSFPVAAAAAGAVIAVHDGEQDHCDCDAVGCASGYGNYVMIQHADGKVTMYGHLARNTLAVAQNQIVECGALLGYVGQSGNTTGPHVHFEVRENGVVKDPFDGSCSGPPSYWVDQGSYLGLPGSTCDGGSPPVGPACGDGNCDAGEDCGGCSSDCGACPAFCGDGICDFDENCSWCSSDCGQCPAWCGDGACNGDESCGSCAQDCGLCGGCSVAGQFGPGENGEACYEAPETWRCVYVSSLGAWGSQVCRSGVWQTFNLNPSDCGACCGGYSAACAG